MVVPVLYLAVWTRRAFPMVCRRKTLTDVCVHVYAHVGRHAYHVSMRMPYSCTSSSPSPSALNRLCLGIADGMSTARAWVPILKMTTSPRRSF